MDNTLDYYKIKVYLKSLADNYTKIDAFIGYNEEELHSEINKKYGISGTILVPFKYEGSLNGNNQRTLAGRIIHFAVLQQYKKGDYDLESRVIADCENIGLAVLSRIAYDSKKPDSNWLYKNFDQNTVEFNEIRLESSAGLVGMEFSFQLKTPQPLSLIVNDWLDIDSI